MLATKKRTSKRLSLSQQNGNSIPTPKVTLNGSHSKAGCCNDSISPYRPPVPDAVSKIEPLVRQILTLLGIDVNSEDFLQTPLRHAKFLVDFCTRIEFEFTTFTNAVGYKGQVLEKQLEYFSLCPHHLLPIYGTAVVSYIPNNNRYCGLSKLARTVTYCSRGMKTQEQICVDIAKHIEKETQALGVAVHLEGKHFCMVMRGAKMKDAITETSHFLGKFETDAALRNEFLSRINNK